MNHWNFVFSMNFVFCLILYDLYPFAHKSDVNLNLFQYKSKGSYVIFLNFCFLMNFVFLFDFVWFVSFCTQIRCEFVAFFNTNQG